MYAQAWDGGSLASILIAYLVTSPMNGITSLGVFPHPNVSVTRRRGVVTMKNAINHIHLSGNDMARHCASTVQLATCVQIPCHSKSAYVDIKFVDNFFGGSRVIMEQKRNFLYCIRNGGNIDVNNGSQLQGRIRILK